jgi:hypothetical protein
VSQCQQVHDSEFLDANVYQGQIILIGKKVKPIFRRNWVMGKDQDRCGYSRPSGRL